MYTAYIPNANTNPLGNSTHNHKNSLTILSVQNVKLNFLVTKCLAIKSIIK